MFLKPKVYLSIPRREHDDKSTGVRKFRERLLSKYSDKFEIFDDYRKVQSNDIEKTLEHEVTTSDVLITLETARTLRDTVYGNLVLGWAKYANTAIIPINVDKRLTVDHYLRKFGSNPIYDASKMTDTELEELADTIEELAQQTRAVRASQAYKSSNINIPDVTKQFWCDIYVKENFSINFEGIYKQSVQPIINKMHLQSKTAESVFGNFGPTHDKWSLIYNAPIILADATSDDPEVFYELGVAYTLDKSVILFIDQAKKLPFDLRSKSVIEYLNVPLEKVSQSTEKMLENILGKSPTRFHHERNTQITYAYKCDIFVVMPFRDVINNIYDDVIKTLGQSMNIEVRRGDDRQKASPQIMIEVNAYLRSARVVIVDLTQINNKPNHNVYYELGIADALGHDVILIAQGKPEDLPSLVQNRRVTIYENSAAGRTMLHSEIEKQIIEMVQ
jgi:nucleoside 2-deoxyribosyltransferase